MTALELRALPARITLISHAPTLALKRASFPLDAPLPEDEIEKVATQGWTAPQAQYVCCGPEKRTQQTAEALSLEPSVAIELADVDYGTWNGKEIEDIHATDPEGLASWLTDVNAVPHGGESFAHLIIRVQRWMKDRTTAGHTMAVTHPSVVRAAILCAIQAPPESFWRIEIAPLTLTDLRFNGKQWTLRVAGCPVLLK
ncbi:histidine phosphatase family protein [Granulicella sp. 5B5]|nr:histidine phosphatase family protein [Granulicella sp. 5B5]